MKMFIKYLKHKFNRKLKITKEVKDVFLALMAFIALFVVTEVAIRKLTGDNWFSLYLLMALLATLLIAGKIIEVFDIEEPDMKALVFSFCLIMEFAFFGFLGIVFTKMVFGEQLSHVTTISAFELYMAGLILIPFLIFCGIAISLLISFIPNLIVDNYVKWARKQQEEEEKDFIEVE